jgi:hypothetical protein
MPHDQLTSVQNMRRFDPTYDEQHAKGRDPVHRPTEHFQARWIDPVRILDDHQHRILACPSRDLRHQRF